MGVFAPISHAGGIVGLPCPAVGQLELEKGGIPRVSGAGGRLTSPVAWMYCVRGESIWSCSRICDPLNSAALPAIHGQDRAPPKGR